MARAALALSVAGTGIGALAVSNVAFADGNADAGGHGHGHGKGHRGHARGAADLLRAADKLPDLTAAQKGRIDGLKAQEKTAREAVKTAHESLAHSLAAQVEANKIDRAALAPQVKAIGDAEASAGNADRAAVDALHDTLSPAQRATLANGIETKVNAMAAAHAAKEQAKQGNGDAQAKHDHADGAGKWAHALGLSPAQEQRIHAALQSTNASTAAARPTPTEVRGKVTTVLEDFKKDSFSASNEPAPFAGTRAQPGHLIDVAQAVLPVLTDAQRTELANLLRGE